MSKTNKPSCDVPPDSGHGCNPEQRRESSTGPAPSKFMIRERRTIYSDGISLIVTEHRRHGSNLTWYGFNIRGPNWSVKTWYQSIDEDKARELGIKFLELAAPGIDFLMGENDGNPDQQTR